MYINEISQVIRDEQKALDELIARLDDNCEKVINEVLNCKGKVVFMAIGKSGHICEKLAATFASTGTPSFFMHAAECFHGDFGMLEAKDFVFLVSNSGTTQEIVRCIPVIKAIGSKICAITKNEDSELASGADYRLLLPKCPEADHLNLAPTVSSTATLVLGDALACVISKIKGFTRENFHLYHPGGALGKQLSSEKK